MTEHEFDNGLEPDAPKGTKNVGEHWVVDDKEERRYWPITKDDYEGIRNGETWTALIVGRWEELPLAPTLQQHTDEEYQRVRDELTFLEIKHQDQTYLLEHEFSREKILEGRILEQEARIKELTEQYENIKEPFLGALNRCDLADKRIKELEAYINVLEVDLGEWMESTHPKITADEIKKHLVELEARK